MFWLSEKDIISIIITTLLFSFLATAHRVLLPNKYSAFLQFKSEEDPKKTAESTAVRIIYIIIMTALLYVGFSFRAEVIYIGIFIAAFLNVWPAVIQYRLLRFVKTKSEWILLTGYVVFITASIFTAYLTVKLLLPMLNGEMQIMLLDNQAISILTTIFAIALPIPIESFLAKFSCVVVVQNIDTFKEEAYILRNQLQIENPILNKYKYIIDDAARENDISVALLSTILKLELIYRGKIYYRTLEYIMCTFLKSITIKRDLSVGIAQIKISTAQKILRENPDSFLQKLLNGKFNIGVCAKVLRYNIESYERILESGEEWRLEGITDIYDYIACEYVGSLYDKKERTALLYSAALRSFASSTCYNGSEATELYHITLKAEMIERGAYDKLKKALESYCKLKEAMLEDGKMLIRLKCFHDYELQQIRDIAEENEIDVYFE